LRHGARGYSTPNPKNLHPPVQYLRRWLRFGVAQGPAAFRTVTGLLYGAAPGRLERMGSDGIGPDRGFRSVASSGVLPPGMEVRLGAVTRATGGGAVCGSDPDSGPVPGPPVATVSGLFNGLGLA
jgi:hypothetical protein